MQLLTVRCGVVQCIAAQAAAEVVIHWVEREEDGRWKMENGNW